MSDAHPGGNEGHERRSRRWSPRRIRAALRERVVDEVRDVVMTRELTGDRYEPRTDLQVVEGDRATMRRFCRQHEELQRQRYRFENYFRNGYHVLMARVGGRVVGHVWWHDYRLAPARRHPHLQRYDLELAPGQVWSFELFLLPENRGGGASNDFFALFRRHLHERGYSRVFGHVEAANLPAVWLHKLQGYQVVKTVEGRLYGKALLWSEGRLFIRNLPFFGRQRFDFRAVW